MNLEIDKHVSPALLGDITLLGRANAAESEPGEILSG